MKNIILLMLFGLLLSCNNELDSKEFYIISNDGAGLKVGSEVLYKGETIGHVENIELYRNSVLITIELDSGREIPTNADLLVGSKDLVTKVIKVLYEESNEKYIQTGDTLNLTIGYRSVPIIQGL